MFVTIVTDISWNVQERRAGFAFSITCDKFRDKKVGMLKGEIEGSTQAEMYCIVNAVAYLLKTYSGFTEILINTDSQSAIRIIRQEHKFKHAWMKESHKVLTELLTAHGVKLVAKHVKAHKGTPDARSYVNDWADKASRKILRSTLKSEKACLKT